MNLLALREKFVTLTGRYDLVIDVDDFADNGADFFINAGQRFLDAYYLGPQLEGEHTETLALGAYSIEVSDLRSVQSVWMQGVEGIFYLKKEHIKQLRNRLEADENEFADVERGAPLFYAVEEATRQAGSTPLVWLPPVDEEFVIHVEGQFWTPTLAASEESSYWSVQFPEILLLAAAYTLEEFHRNRSGMADYLSAIDLRMTGVQHDRVREAWVGRNRQPRSW